VAPRVAQLRKPSGRRPAATVACLERHALDVRLGFVVQPVLSSQLSNCVVMQHHFLS